ncbi:DUF3662 domain-containing protein [Streptomyces sp. NPDC048650]|uniref:DUF3662 domain-containing protein n=1 Tax=unclassified Streptomyces TaxID=2593676 RepID=UPI0037102DB6
MGFLRRMERVVEECESTLLAKIFPTEPVELFDDLRDECDDHAIVCSPDRVLVPNDYTVELARVVHDKLAEESGQVGRQLTDVLARHAAERGYEWAGPLTVHVTTADVPNGRYRISSAALAHVPAAASGPSSSHVR